MTRQVNIRQGGNKKRKAQQALQAYKQAVIAFNQDKTAQNVIAVIDAMLPVMNYLIKQELDEIV